MKKKICLILSMLMILASVPCRIVGAADTVTITASNGWLESAYAEWTPIDGADGYNVYSKKSGGEYVKLDAPLVREYPDYFRADALGLSAGDYTLKIVPVKGGAEIADAAAETGTLTVSAYDRSGFAFSKNSPVGTASGAYNDDGTLKENADVIYVTNGNKDTVTVNGDPSQGIGLPEILHYRQQKKITKPLAVRLIGRVEDPAGLTRHTVQIQGWEQKTTPMVGQSLTIEGVGDDAAVYGWLMCLKRMVNVEIRNLAVMYAGEGAEASSIEMDTDNFNIWVHNCDFLYNAPGKDADQAKGDGAVAFKSGSSYVTVSYNHMWDLGKNFVSGGPWENSNMYSPEAHYYATYHHNWFDHGDSRMPRCVVGDNHVYNNYYDGVAMYGIGAAMKTSVFSECNYFRHTNRPMLIASQGSDVYNSGRNDYMGSDGDGKGTLSGQMGGMIKSFGDVSIDQETLWFYGNEKDTGQFDAYEAKSRDERVPDSVKALKGDPQGFGTYDNFDTDPDIMYEYTSESAEQAVETVKKYAGRVEGGDFEWTFDNAVDDTHHGINQALLDKITNYKSSVVSVGGGLPLIPPEPEPTATPDPAATSDPSATAKPTSAPVAPPEGDVKPIPVGADSFAKDWNGGQSMSAGDISADGYVGCYKGGGNSYKSNSFSVDGVSITRGYQAKKVDSRSFYIIPESECMITVYFYSGGTNTLGLYLNPSGEPDAVCAPDHGGGDYSFTYHFENAGSALYIASPMGDINIAGVSVRAVPGGSTAEPTKEPAATSEPTKEPAATAEPTKEPSEPSSAPSAEPPATQAPEAKGYSVISAETGADGLTAKVDYIGAAAPEARLIAAKYKDGALSGIKDVEIKGAGDYAIPDFTLSEGETYALYIWSDLNGIKPYSEKFEK